MNKFLEQFQQRVHKWGEDRGLNIPQQRRGLYRNLIEEWGEFVRATNNEARVDALCDLSVFIFGAYEDFIPTNIRASKGIEWGLLLNEVLTQALKLDYKYNWRNVQFDLPDYNDDKDIKGLYFECITYIVELLKQLGYDPQECLNETLKEIESRRGFFDPTLDKWVKTAHGSYKADYKKCLAEASSE